jgi:hypothetical protein
MACTFIDLENENVGVVDASRMLAPTCVPCLARSGVHPLCTHIPRVPVSVMAGPIDPLHWPLSNGMYACMYRLRVGRQSGAEGQRARAKVYSCLAMTERTAALRGTVWSDIGKNGRFVEQRAEKTVRAWPVWLDDSSLPHTLQ